MSVMAGTLPPKRGSTLGNLFREVGSAATGSSEEAKDHQVKTLDDWCSESWVTIQVQRGDMIKKPRGGHELFLCFSVTIAIKKSVVGAPLYFTTSRPFTRQVVFDAYRGLYSELAKAGVAFTMADAPFPPRFTLGKLGYTPDEDFLSNRCFMLNKWFNSICARCSSFDNTAKMILFTFLNIHPRPNHNDLYDVALRGILSAGNVIGTELNAATITPALPASGSKYDAGIMGRSKSQATHTHTATFLSSDRAFISRGASTVGDSLSDCVSVLSGYTEMNYRASGGTAALLSSESLVKGIYVSVTLSPSTEDDPGAVRLYKILLEIGSRRSDRLSVSYSFANIAKLHKEVVRLAGSSALKSERGLKTFPREPRGDATKAPAVCNELTAWMAAVLRAYSLLAYAAQQAILRFLCIDVNDPSDIIGPIIAGRLSADDRGGTAYAGDDNIQGFAAALSPLKGRPFDTSPVLLAGDRVQLRMRLGDILIRDGGKLQLSYCLVLSVHSEGLMEDLSITRAFSDYRALYTDLSKIGLLKLRCSDVLINKFPTAYTKSAFGAGLTSAEVVSRLLGLHAWFSQLLGVFEQLPQDSKQLVLDFLEFGRPANFDIKAAALKYLDPQSQDLVISAKRNESFDSSCSNHINSITKCSIEDIEGSTKVILGGQMQVSTRFGPPVIEQVASGTIGVSFVLRMKVLTGKPNLLSPWEAHVNLESLTRLKQRLTDSGLTTAVYTHGVMPSLESCKFLFSASAKAALEETGRRVASWFSSLLDKFDEMPAASQGLMEDFLLLTTGDPSTGAMRTIVHCMLRQQPVPATETPLQQSVQTRGGCHCTIS